MAVSSVVNVVVDPADTDLRRECLKNVRVVLHMWSISSSTSTKIGSRFAGIVVLSIALVAVAGWMAQLGWHSLIVQGVVQSERDSLGALWKAGVVFQTERMHRWNSSFSRDPTLVAALMAGDTQQITPLVEPSYNRLTALGVISAVSLVNAEGVKVFAMPDQERSDLPLESVTRALLERRVVMGVDLGNEGVPKVVMVSPLFGGRGVLAGAVVLTQDLDAVLHALGRSSNVLLMLFDHNNRLHAASDREQARKFLEPLMSFELPYERELITVEGRDWRWLAYPVEMHEGQENLRLVRVTDETESVRAQYLAISVLLGGMLLVVSTFMAWVYRFIVRHGDMLRVEQEQRIAELDAANKMASQANDQLQQMHLELSKLFVEKESAHIQELELRHRLEDTQSQLLQAEKMASIGQLAAGVAHEINNPVGYISSNVATLRGYLQDLEKLLEAYIQAEQQPIGSDVWAVVTTLKSKMDLSFLREDVWNLLGESEEGLNRVKRIVQDLKDFSHVDGSEWATVDVHRGLDSTINVAWNEIKYNADVVREYGLLPQVYCLASQLNQVFMNLLVNAAQAMEERGIIWIRTGMADAGWVWVEVEDTGKGIAPEHIKRIFDPFFTTKPVGKGTGLGLSLAYGIVHKHGGRINVESFVGKGTRIRIWLPVERVVKGNAESVTV